MGKYFQGVDLDHLFTAYKLLFTNTQQCMLIGLDWSVVVCLELAKLFFASRSLNPHR